MDACRRTGPVLTAEQLASLRYTPPPSGEFGGGSIELQRLRRGGDGSRDDRSLRLRRQRGAAALLFFSRTERDSVGTPTSTGSTQPAI